jgi:hypothetical protein
VVTLQGVRESEPDEGVTLAELLASFSLATDLGLGQPMEHVLRSWRIASRLGEQVGLDDGEQASLYYIAVLAWVGCVADTPEVARWFGDDIAFRGDSYDTELAGLAGFTFMLGHVGAGNQALHRLRLAATLVATGGKGIEKGLLSHCLTTSRMADLLGMGPQVCDPLKQFFTRWDGKGMPRGIGRADIATTAATQARPEVSACGSPARPPVTRVARSPSSTRRPDAPPSGSSCPAGPQRSDDRPPPSNPSGARTDPRSFVFEWWGDQTGLAAGGVRPTAAGPPGHAARRRRVRTGDRGKL